MLPMLLCCSAALARHSLCKCVRWLTCDRIALHGKFFAPLSQCGSLLRPNLLHLRRCRRCRRRLLICHSCETLRGRKVSPPRCFFSFFLASLAPWRSHKIMIGIFAGNLNCLPAFFLHSTLLSSFSPSLFFFNYLQFSFSTRFPVYFMQHLRRNTWKWARNSWPGILR